jgi:hypothetical protein
LTTSVYLVIGSSASAREAAVAALIKPGESVAVLAEGLPDGADVFQAHAGPSFHIARVAPACLCCTGMLTTRVILNRLLQRKPEKLFLALASDMHLDKVEAVFQDRRYQGLAEIKGRLQAD